MFFPPLPLWVTWIWRATFFILFCPSPLPPFFLTSPTFLFQTFYAFPEFEIFRALAPYCWESGPGGLAPQGFHLQDVVIFPGLRQRRARSFPVRPMRTATSYHRSPPPPPFPFFSRHFLFWLGYHPKNTNAAFCPPPDVSAAAILFLNAHPRDFRPRFSPLTSFFVFRRSEWCRERPSPFFGSAPREVSLARPFYRTSSVPRIPLCFSFKRFSLPIALVGRRWKLILHPAPQTVH